MNQASIQLTVFLFHIETCVGVAVSITVIVFLLVGFARTKLLGFLLLAIGLGGDLVQLLFHYVAFLRAYEIPPALKIAATGVYVMSEAIAVIGAIALAFGAQKALKTVSTSRPTI
jgi:hypothetical protein